MDPKEITSAEEFVSGELCIFDGKLCVCAEIGDHRSILEIKKKPDEACLHCYGRGWTGFNETLWAFEVCGCVQDGSPRYYPLEN